MHSNLGRDLSHEAHLAGIDLGNFFGVIVTNDNFAQHRAVLPDLLREQTGVYAANRRYPLFDEPVVQALTLVPMRGCLAELVNDQTVGPDLAGLEPSIKLLINMNIAIFFANTSYSKRLVSSSRASGGIP